MSRVEELAAEFEHVCGSFADYVEGLGSDWWTMIAANHPDIAHGEDESRPVGVVAHHVAVAIPAIAEIARRRAAGEETPPFDIDAANARHAAENPRPEHAETVALIRANGARAAAVIRGLGEDTLAAAGSDGTALPVEQFIRMVLIGHFRQHEGSIRATVGAPRP